MSQGQRHTMRIAEPQGYAIILGTCCCFIGLAVLARLVCVLMGLTVQDSEYVSVESRSKLRMSFMQSLKHDPGQPVA